MLVGRHLANKMDVLENTFGYVVGRGLGMNAQDIVFLGEDGARVSKISQQLARLQDVRSETLPPYVLVHLSGNDLCEPGALTDEIPARAAAFRAKLNEEWSKVLASAKAHRLSTEVIILDSPDVRDAFTNEQLLNQKVPFGIWGQSEVSCQQMRAGTMPTSLLAGTVATILQKVCPSIASTKPSDTARIERLQKVQDAYRQQWREVAAELNQKQKGIHFRFLSPSAEEKFVPQAGDMANDCFHPSVIGHARAAGSLLKAIAKPQSETYESAESAR